MEQQNNNQKYYWLGSYPLEEGSIILPGNWGRIVNLYKSDGPVLLYLRERIFEEVRLESFSNLPSRMNCNFLFESMEQAKEFQNHEAGRYVDILYEVEIIDNSKLQFRGDLNALHWPPAPFFLKDIDKMAYNYWQGENIQYPEILTESPIKIIRKIE